MVPKVVISIKVNVYKAVLLTLGMPHASDQCLYESKGSTQYGAVRQALPRSHRIESTACSQTARSDWERCPKIPARSELGQQCLDSGQRDRESPIVSSGFRNDRTKGST